MDYLIAGWIISAIMAWSMTYAYCWHRFNRKAFESYQEGRIEGYDQGKFAANHQEWHRGFEAGVISKGIKKRMPNGQYCTAATWKGKT